MILRKSGKCDTQCVTVSARKEQGGKTRFNPSRGIYKRGDVFWLNFQRAGDRHFISLETGDEIEAIRRAQRLRTGPELGTKSAISADIDEFLRHKAKLNLFSRSTARVHGAVLREFETHSTGLSARDIRASHIAAHYGRLQKRVKETTAQIHIRALSSFFAFCVETRRATANPVKEIRLARIDSPARLKFCTRSMRDSLIADCPHDDLRFIFFCGFHSGMRKGEIIEARVGWFDLDGASLNIENTDTFRVKDRDARHIPLTAPFLAFLRTYLRDREPTSFALKPTVKQGRGTYRYDFHRPFNSYLVLQQARWVTAHVMRHTFASLLVQSGVSVFKVAKWLGDGVEVVEKHYAHLMKADSDIERML